MNVNLLPMLTPLCLLNKIILCNSAFSYILSCKYVYQGKECHRDNIVFLLLLDIGQKVVLGFSALQVFGYLSSSLFLSLYYS